MPRVRSIAASAKPASDQKNKKRARHHERRGPPEPFVELHEALSTSVTYDHAITATAARKPTRLIQGLRTRKRAFFERATRGR